MELSLSGWFQRISDAVAVVVGDCGGAIVMTRRQIVEEAQEVDATLMQCPTKVKEHVLCALRPRVGLRTVAFDVSHSKGPCRVVLVYDPKVHPTMDRARDHCLEDGLPDEVMIELMDMGVVAVS